MRHVVLAIALAGCAELPDLGVCGNGVVEEANGEACDDGAASAACTATCELACQTAAFEDYVVVGTDRTADPDEMLFCPDASFACGNDRICRQPSGRLEDPEAPVSFEIRHPPVVADFDADQYPDLIGTSPTSIFVRFGAAGAPLSSLQVQEAPSSTSPLVVFEVDDPMLASTVHAATPTEGLALLRSDTERFAPQLDFISTMVPTDRQAVIVTDPDPAFGNVMIVVAAMSPTPEINVARLPVKIGQFAGIPQAALPPCVGTAPGAWRTVDVAVSRRGRPSFVVVTAKVTAPAAWHVCHYTQSGLGWTQSSSIEIVGPPPNSIVLANLDGDECEELLVQGATYERLDAATPPACAFVPGTAAVTHDTIGAAPALLGAGQIVPLATDEIVTTAGVYSCAAITDCTIAGLRRDIQPSTVTAWVDAALTDLNGDGAIDVVAGRAMQDDVDVVRGGLPLNVYRSDTASPVTRVLAGDFDGDRLGDVALVESSLAGDRVAVVFGTRDGVLGSAAAMTDFGGKLVLHRLTAAPWIPSARGTDGIDDILVIRTDQNTARAGLSMGDATRLLTTPRFPPTVNQVRDLGAVVAGRFGSPDLELLAIADATSPGATILQLYNVRANMWAPELALMAEVRPPLGSLRGATESLAVGVTGDEATPNFVTFNARSPMPACTSTRMAAPRELRGVDVDGDDIDELAVYTGEGPTRTVELYNARTCPFSRLAQLPLERCVDVARVGPRVFALCRAGDGPARLLFELAGEGTTFTRSAEPVARVEGDGRFLAPGDFDGDGVTDLAVGIGLGTGINLQMIRQCPAHDTRRCE